MASDLTRVPLHRLAHGRAGDKGDSANISVIAYRPEVFPLLVEQVTEAGSPTCSAIARRRRSGGTCCPGCTR